MQPLEVDPAEVSQAVGHEISSYDAEPIDPQLRLHSVTGGVYRIRGGGRSVVLKVVRRARDDDPGALWVAGGDVAHRNYWKREWLAYDSGLLERLPGRLRPPRSLLTTQPQDDECHLWLQDVDGRPGATWSVDDYAQAAYDVGTTQGAFAADPSLLPREEWLSRDWLRGWVDVCARLVDALADDATLHDDRLAALRPLRKGILRLWAAREQVLRLVEEAPRTVVHCDLWAHNLFAGNGDDVDGDATVAIDWSQVGIGALGQDLDQMTLDTVWMQVRPGESLEALEQAVVPAYLRGLRDAGCDVDEDDLARWYAAAAAARYAWMAGLLVERAGDPREVATQEARFGRPFADVVTDRARVLRRALDLGERAIGSGA